MSARPGKDRAAHQAGTGWSELQRHLQALTSAVQDEIRTYPTPIAGCDQQFNHLIEKRDRIVGEAHRITDAIARGDHDLALGIVRMSADISDDIKAGLMGGRSEHSPGSGD